MNTPTIYTATPADLSPPVQTDSFCVDLVLATEYQKLKDEFKQIAAENVALKQFPEQIVQFIGGLGTSEIGIDTKEKIGLAAISIKTPATDRIVAEAEARGVEKAIAHLEKKFSNIGVQIMNLQWLADSLREGADK
ncbi:TPA: hypothetical protein MYN30_001066 [Klebsiella variicola subsp. variicola]|nr:hypothetical protein [Klebsiella variicola subsp. variicola]